MIAEPIKIFKNAVDKRGVLGVRVCVVETKIADAPKFLGEFKVEGDRFRVTDMEVSIWLRRKPCLYPPAESSGDSISSNEFSNEIV